MALNMSKFLEVSATRRVLPLLLLLIIGCNKKHDEIISPGQASINPNAVQVSLQINRLGQQINENFLGLGYEMRDITDSNYFRPTNKTLINLFNNLAPAVIRIGAVSVDLTTWSGKERLPTTPLDTITKTDIDRFNSFLQLTNNWTAIFGLNLGNKRPDLAVDEAKYVSNELGSRLLNFELGNEPEAYKTNQIRTPSYSYNDYKNESETYFRALRQALPGVPLSGPGIVTETNWYTNFARDARSYISMLTSHHYHMGPATSSAMTIDRLLRDVNWLTRNMLIWKQVATSSNLPYRVSECNSVYGGGRKGVSNTFASALWAADIMWTLAINNCHGVNFHVGYNADDWYTAFIEENGVFTARPLYYGMLFFKAGSSGRIVPLQIDSKGLKVSAYACAAPDGKLFISLINKEVSTATNVQIHTGKLISTAASYSLSAPSIDAETGVTFAGNTVNVDGTFTTHPPLNVEFSGSTVDIHLPSASAILIIAN